MGADKPLAAIGLLSNSGRYACSMHGDLFIEDNDGMLGARQVYGLQTPKHDGGDDDDESTFRVSVFLSLSILLGDTRCCVTSKWEARIASKV